MKNKILLGFRLLVILSFCISLFGQQITIVKADLSCTWNGLVSSDWNTIGNWSDCTPLNGSPRVPNADDDAIIPDTSRDPVFSTPSESITVRTLTVMDGAVVSVNMYGGISAETITIDAGGTVLMHGYTAIGTTTITNNGTLISDNIGSPFQEANLTIFSTSFTNAGTIRLTGNENSSITIDSPFDNNGTVQIDQGGLKITKSGTHSGVFSGTADTWILFDGQGFSGQTVTFQENSELDFPYVTVTGLSVNFNGIYAPSIYSDLFINSNSSEPGVFRFESESGMNYLNKIENNFGLVVFSSNLNYDYRILELQLGLNGVVQNDDSLEILNKFDWRGGTLKGSGTTTVASPAIFPISSLTHYLDGHDLINQTIANWNSGNILLTNDATFTNASSTTFNANATTTMNIGTGTANAFINNGLFTKNTAGTTTTINTDFTNNGELEILDGELVFGGNLTSGVGTTINLGDGTLNPGDTLTLSEGSILVGSGTLSSHLVNGGVVSPGNSPGIMTIEGDYTQTADGILEIELAGTNPGSDFDQLIVTGDATLDGKLIVSLMDSYVPRYGDSFEIISANYLYGEFEILSLPSLPPSLTWDVISDADSLTIAVAGGGMIYGTVTYTGMMHIGDDVTIGLHSAVNDPPLVSLDYPSGDPYSFMGIPDGTYYVSAFIDANDSGGAPDPNEPFEWYVDVDGNPQAIIISGGNTVNNIDITLTDVGFSIFLPLITR